MSGKHSLRSWPEFAQSPSGSAPSQIQSLPRFLLTFESYFQCFNAAHDAFICCTGTCPTDPSSVASCAVAGGEHDPHYEVTSAEDTEAGAQRLTFDFHGEANRTYCMVSDALLQVSAGVTLVTSTSSARKAQSKFSSDNQCASKRKYKCTAPSLSFEVRTFATRY